MATYISCDTYQEFADDMRRLNFPGALAPRPTREEARALLEKPVDITGLNIITNEQLNEVKNGRTEVV